MSTELAAATPRSRRWALGPWVVWLAALVEAALIGLAPVVFRRPFAAAGMDGDLGFVAFLLTIATVVMVFASAGILVTRRQPRNLVGWLMLIGGPSLALIFLGYLVGVVLIDTEPTVASWFVLAAEVAFGPAIFVLGPLLAAVFPDGRPVSRRWGQAMGACAVGIAIGAVGSAVGPGRLEESIPLDNPLGVAVLPAGLRAGGDLLTGLALVAGAVIGPASLVARYRAARDDVRHQLKWFVFAGIAWAILVPISLAVGENWSAALALITLGLVPVAVVVAIRRYRLYEIDTLINRTLVYIPLVGIVAGLYAGLVALLQRTFTALTGDTSDAAAVISALVLAAVFTPIRTTIQAAVDRRFKPADAKPAERWDDPAFRAAVEAIVRDVTAVPRAPVSQEGGEPGRR